MPSDQLAIVPMGSTTAVCHLSAVLQQVLQYSDICTNQRCLCRLLCTSKAIRTTIKEQCKGQVCVQFCFDSLQQVQVFVGWLRLYGKLLRSLSLGMTWQGPTAGPRKDAATNLLAEALRHAAAAEPVGLFLQDVQLQKLTCNRELLQQLQHSRHLTSLEMRLVQNSSKALPNDQPQQEHGQWAESLLPALAGLVSLQKLVLHSKTVWGAPNGVDGLLPALSAFTQLTALEIDAPHSTTALQHIPQQLQRLHLVPNRFLEDSSPELLQLSHLTALKVLDNSKMTVYSDTQPRVSCRMVLSKHDQLPESLQTLVLKDTHSAAPFKRLQQLQMLVLSQCSTSAADLQLIATYCKQLQSVQLWYVNAGLESAGAAWQWLPVTRLHISASQISTEMFQHIAGLHSHLSCLDIRRSSIRASAEQTAELLAQLTGLRILQLDLVHESLAGLFFTADLSLQSIVHTDIYNLHQQEVQPHHRVDSHTADVTVLQHHQPLPVVSVPPQLSMMHAIASLQKLTSLMLSSADHQPGVVDCIPADGLCLLGSATQLTNLKLCRVGVVDRVLQGLVSKLTALRRLVVTHAAVTDACLKNIADSLHGLQWLDLSMTSVTAEGLQQFHISRTSVGLMPVSRRSTRYHAQLQVGQRRGLSDIGF